MAGFPVNQQFFRFRSAFVTKGEGGAEFDWLSSGLQYIDFNYDILFYECSTLGYVTKGMYNFDKIIQMDFKDYENLIRQTNKMIEDMKKQVENG
jgi:hypothetical protein